MIDEDRAALHTGKGAVLAEHDRPQVVVIADATEDDFPALRGLARRRLMLAAELFRPLLGFGGRAVVDGDDVAALLGEMSGHRVAHHAETQKRNIHWRILRVGGSACI